MGCLFAGCTYQVRIRAENSSGWGQYCMPTEVKSAPGVPHASGVPKGISRSPTSIDLEWACPRHDGGSDVASYRLEMSSGKLCCNFLKLGHKAAAYKRKGSDGVQRLVVQTYICWAAHVRCDSSMQHFLTSLHASSGQLQYAKVQSVCPLAVVSTRSLYMGSGGFLHA